MNDTPATVDRFFQRYGAALLARDEVAVAGLYAVPALILSPGSAIAVSDASQTEQFFASAWPHYDGVDEAHPDITVMGQVPAPSGPT